MGLGNWSSSWKYLSAMAVLLGALGNTNAIADEYGPLKVNFLALTDFSAAEKTKLYQAAEVLEYIVNSEEFKQAVLNFTYQGKKQFVDNRGMTNEQIYATLRRGNEVLLGRDDETLDLDLTLYTPPWWKKRTVVGYTYSDTMRIWLNRYFFTDFTLVQIAANLVHEWCHKLGFGHDYYSTSSRPYSVPYGVGGIVTGMAATMLGKPSGVVELPPH